MADNIDHEEIYYSTNKNLANLLRKHNSWRRGEPPYDKAGAEPPFTAKEVGVLIEEAARRIENFDNIMAARVPFNHEAFNT